MPDNTEIAAQIHAALKHVDAATAAMQQALLWATQTGNVPARLAFSWPVGDITRRMLAPWIVAQGWATTYPISMGRSDWHTGSDLNLNVPVVYSDVNAEVYACADGVVKFAGQIKGWQGSVVVLEHTLPDGRLIWSRYAHINTVALPRNLFVSRGELLGNIADYLPKGPTMDHLHFDIKVNGVSLADKPGDWPDKDIARLRDEYVDPIAWTLDNLP